MHPSRASPGSCRGETRIDQYQTHRTITKTLSEKTSKSPRKDPKRPRKEPEKTRKDHNNNNIIQEDRETGQFKRPAKDQYKTRNDNNVTRIDFRRRRHDPQRQHHRSDTAAPCGGRHGRRPIKAPAHTDQDRIRLTRNEPIAAPLRGSGAAGAFYGAGPTDPPTHRHTDAPTHRQARPGPAVDGQRSTPGGSTDTTVRPVAGT